MDKQAIQQQALSNARNGASFSNYPAIISGFMEKGLQAADIQPRVNVFTFHAWKALGRQVRNGEHGVKVCTYVAMDKVKHDDATGADKVETWKAPRMTTVFHVSQTEEIGNSKVSPVIAACASVDSDKPKTAEQQGFTIGGYYSTEFTPTA